MSWIANGYYDNTQSDRINTLLWEHKTHIVLYFFTFYKQMQKKKTLPVLTSAGATAQASHIAEATHDLDDLPYFILHPHPKLSVF